jgi:hypothetical protein
MIIVKRKRTRSSEKNRLFSLYDMGSTEYKKKKKIGGGGDTDTQTARRFHGPFIV